MCTEYPLIRLLMIHRPYSRSLASKILLILLISFVLQFSRGSGLGWIVSSLSNVDGADFPLRCLLVSTSSLLASGEILKSFSISTLIKISKFQKEHSLIIFICSILLLRFLFTTIILWSWLTVCWTFSENPSWEFVSSIKKGKLTYLNVTAPFFFWHPQQKLDRHHHLLFVVGSHLCHKSSLLCCSRQRSHPKRHEMKDDPLVACVYQRKFEWLLILPFWPKIFFQERVFLEDKSKCKLGEIQISDG